MYLTGGTQHNTIPLQRKGYMGSVRLAARLFGGGNRTRLDARANFAHSNVTGNGNQIKNSVDVQMGLLWQKGKRLMLKLVIPMLPPAECSPNSRCHWSIKKRAGDAFGNAVYYEAYNANRHYPKVLPFERAEISLTLVVKQDRRRDLDNYWTRFKPGCDALVKAGILLDDDMKHLQHGKMEVKVSKIEAPLTIIEIRDLTGKEK